MSDPFPSLSVSARLTPSTADADIGATLSQRATERGPPCIRVALTNAADGPRRLDAGFTPPFSTYVLSRDDRNRGGGDEGPALVFAPPNHPDQRYVPSESNEGCWTATGVPEVLETGTLTTLDAGETVADEYVILNHSKNDSYLPAGRYTAADTVRFGESPSPLELEIAVEVAWEDGN